MSTYLELVQDLARESGTVSPSSITSVVGQTGRIEKLVYWVRKAYIDLQNDRLGQWHWMYAEAADKSITSGTGCYTGASFGLTRFGNWVVDADNLMPVSIYLPATGLSDEGALRQIDWPTWYTKYGRGEQTHNRPTEYAISPSNEICFGPIPDDTYTLRFPYYKSPQELTANADTPEMPSRFHDLITYMARRKMLIHDGAFQEAQMEAPEMAALRFQLECDQLDEVKLG